MNIKNIEKHDLIYIYHHLKIGSELVYAPYLGGVLMFKGFVLGEIDVDADIFEKGKVTFLVKKMVKQKFLPPTEIEVSVNIEI